MQYQEGWHSSDEEAYGSSGFLLWKENGYVKANGFLDAQAILKSNLNCLNGYYVFHVLGNL